MSPIDIIVSRLDQVRKRQTGQWSARCPAHEDRKPSLSVRETPEGAVLIHCFAGCTYQEVLASIHLQPSDLYPPRSRPTGTPDRLPKLLSPAQALEMLASESNLIAIAGTNVGLGVILSDLDTKRILLAAGRIKELYDLCQKATP